MHRATHLTCVLRATMTSYTHPLINQPLKGKYKAFYLCVILIGCIWNFSARFAQIWLMIRTQICTSLYCMDLDNFFLHNASICHNQLYYCFWCIHICILRVLDWWIYIFQILENFSISIEWFPFERGNLYAILIFKFPMKRLYMCYYTEYLSFGTLHCIRDD